ncbi:MAG TPA: AsmA family protein, partial [Halomonas sp.]|nr:AsmA family protein [Halomonas sp.]
ERWGITRLNDPDEREQAEQVVEQVVEQAVEEMAWDRRWAERLATLRAFEARVDLAIGQLSYGDHTLRDVALDARLTEGRLDVTRLHAAQEGSELTLQGWLEVHAETLSGDVNAQLAAVDLDEALGPLGFETLGTLDGRLQVDLVDGALTLDDTSLDYQAPARSLALHVEADAAELAGTSESGVHLQGDGRYRDEPFAFDLRVGPLLNLDDPDTPYPVQGQVSSRDSFLEVDGTVEQPLAISAVQGAFELSGPDPAQLNRLTGLNLPALPPYSLQGQLQVRDGLIDLNDVTGRVGNSDASGDVRLQLGERNMLWATLHSQQLDLDDLAPLIGAAPATGEGEVASPDQQRQAHEEERQSGVFPDRRWNVQGLRRMDAELRYSASSVSAEDIPLTDVQLDLSLDDGVLTLTPLRVGLGGGEAIAQVRMEAQEEALQGNLELTLSRVDLKAILQKADLAEIAEDTAGTLGGEGQVSFTGDSMAAAMASLDGSLALAMSGGQLHMLVLEGMGLDVGEALLGALADSQEVPMRCAYARLSAAEGMTTLEQLFIDTEDSNITGTGTIDLASEQVALVFEAHAKDFSVLASDSPVKLQGPLDDLGIDVVSRELLARGLLSVLGALVAPPLAILPWIEPGTGENVGPGCQQVMEEFAAEKNDG